MIVPGVILSATVYSRERASDVGRLRYSRRGRRPRPPGQFIAIRSPDESLP